MTRLPPAPTGAPAGSPVWVEWYRQLRDYLTSAGGSIAWSAVSKSGSNITDLATRAHNSLQSLQGGTTSEYYHLTSTQNTDLTDGGTTTLHGHLIRPYNKYPTTLTVTTGTLTTGTVTNLQARGGTDVVITEVTGVPGFDVELVFASLPYISLGFVLEGWYAGSTPHDVAIQAYNYTTSAWDRYGTMASTSTKQRYSFLYMLGSDYVSSGNAKLRLYHSNSGTGTHTLNLDYAAIVAVETY